MQQNDNLIPDGLPAALVARLLAAPVSRVQWVYRERLHPNNYNPNKVAPPEMELLVRSILEDGFTQPIVISRHEVGGKIRDIIVDGFHRYTVSGWPQVMNVYGGYVPTVFLTPLDRAHQMLSTIRHNRARGTHGVLPMAEIVQAMLQEGLPPEEIMDRCGMEREEVNRLANRAGITSSPVIAGTNFSKAWQPSQ